MKVNDYRELHRTAREYGLTMLIRDGTVKVFWDNPRECCIIQEKIRELGMDIVSSSHCRNRRAEGIIVSKFKVQYK